MGFGRGVGGGRESQSDMVLAVPSRARLQGWISRRESGSHSEVAGSAPKRRGWLECSNTTEACLSRSWTQQANQKLRHPCQRLFLSTGPLAVFPRTVSLPVPVALLHDPLGAVLHLPEHFAFWALGATNAATVSALLLGDGCWLLN